MSVEVKLRSSGLKNVIKALGAKNPVIKIGVLGSNGSAPRDPKAQAGDISFEQLMRKRTVKEGEEEPASPPTNADILAAHEYGTTHMEQRSVLRYPLITYLNQYMENAGAYSRASMEALLASGTLRPFFEKTAITAETVVQDGFDSQGFGTWADWKDPNYKNNAGMVLVDTTQLRKAITTEVK